MARRNRYSGVTSALNSFSKGYSIGSKVQRDLALKGIESAQAEDIMTAAPATPEQTSRATAETGAIAAQDAVEFGLDKPMEYRAPGQAMAKTGVKYLGKEFEGEMSDGQKERTKMSAQAGVLSRTGDILGASRLRREAKESERDDLRFDREKKRYDKEDDADAKLKAYEEDRKTTMSNLRRAKIDSEHNSAMQDYLKTQKQYEADKAAGKSVGVAPTQPVQGEYTQADALADRAALLEVKSKYGKAEDKDILEMGDMLRNVQQEGYIQALKLAQNGAPLGEVVTAFNSTGKMKLDPATVSEKMVPGKNGEPPSRMLMVADGKGGTRTIPVLAELDKFGKAESVFTRFFQGKSDARADRADARAGAAAGRAAGNEAQAVAEKRERADTAEALFVEKNPSATAAERKAVRAGIMDAVPKAGSIESDFKPDSWGSGGTATQRDKNGNMVITKLNDKGQPMPSVTIAAPGRTPAPANPVAGKPQRGEERAVAAGPNKGKTVVYDGNGWVLK